MNKFLLGREMKQWPGEKEAILEGISSHCDIISLFRGVRWDPTSGGRGSLAGMSESEREIEKENSGIFLQFEGEKALWFPPFSPRPSPAPMLDESLPPPFYLTLFSPPVHIWKCRQVWMSANPLPLLYLLWVSCSLQRVCCYLCARHSRNFLWALRSLLRALPSSALHCPLDLSILVSPRRIQLSIPQTEHTLNSPLCP